MKKTTWLLAATLIGCGVIGATPSSAQVQFGIGPDGPNIQIGPDNDRRYERRIERRRYEDRATTGSIERCRTVIVREEDEFGDEVTRRVRRCR
ncbi:hypothetical protein [Microvirga guangxiensis]|uniref:hypothetical protein n=1 Tax=Microvirga guangxiensis TaxID=549386 RepID=UPI0011141D1A|nr:hypothetical protein [Microvirga guangxiensis]